MSRTMVATALSGAMALLLAAGCAGPSVFTEHPLGERPAAFAARDWDVTWLVPFWLGKSVGDGEQRQDAYSPTLLVTRLADAEQAKLEVAILETDGSNCGSLEFHPFLQVREAATKGWYFAVPEPTGGLYPLRPEWRRIEYFPLVRRDANDLVLLYRADEVRFILAVGQGKLPGQVRETSGLDSIVVLHDLSPEHYRTLLSREAGLFDWQSPRPLTRLPRELDPCKKGAGAR